MAPEVASSSDLQVMSEGELAAMRAADGEQVVLHRGRHWRRIFPGFFQPIHLLARLRAMEASRPSFLCWGYRTALAEEDAHLANASIPVHLLADIARFREGDLDESRRRDLRRCRREVVYRRIQDPGPLVEQGYAVFRSAQRRVPYWPELSESEYRARMDRRARDPRRLIIGGFVNGALGGYLESYAVDGMLYADELFVASEVMRTGIGTGLYVETVEFGLQAGTVHAACIGLHTPERTGLTTFKEGLGFPIVHVPGRAVMPAPIGAYIRARRPAVHYRLTGVAQPSSPSVGP